MANCASEHRQRQDPILPATDGFPVHSFATLLAELAQPKRAGTSV
jgi:hypothetical protein